MLCPAQAQTYEGRELVQAKLLAEVTAVVPGKPFTVGLLLRNPESAQAAAFPVMAPLVFASSAFVPVASMPGWLQPFAAHQPVSVTASAARALILGTPASSDVLQALAWAAAILLIFVPLAVWRYRRAL